MTGFVKLDCGILDSTLWAKPIERDVFLTALCMARPFDITEPMKELHVETGEETGWSVPPGEYGFVRSAGVGILRRAVVTITKGTPALVTLSLPEPDSRSADFEGRRLVRVDGGFIVLNYQKYRDRDYTAAERQQRRRDKLKAADGESSRRDACDVTRDNRDGHVSRSIGIEEKDRRSAKRAFPADADEKGWKKLADELNVKTIPGEDWNDFKSRIRKAWHGRWGKG